MTTARIKPGPRLVIDGATFVPVHRTLFPPGTTVQVHHLPRSPVAVVVARTGTEAWSLQGGGRLEPQDPRAQGKAP